MRDSVCLYLNDLSDDHDNDYCINLQDKVIK